MSQETSAPQADPLAEMQRSLRPYSDQIPALSRLPQAGIERNEVLGQIELMATAEKKRWSSGKSSGAVYQGDDEHIAFLNKVYALQSQSNPLHLDIWPSGSKFEAEIVAMTASMLGAGNNDGDFVGTVTSGGTESILLAIKSYRDQARAERGITEPNVVTTTTSHVAFDKAAQYFGVELRRIETGEDGSADVPAMAAAIDENTIALVASAPGFPHGIIDPIEELSELALAHGIGLHTDCCLGGFVLPWAVKLGYVVPEFDFRLPGVTSISCDTHKYGYAAKGTSVILYRSNNLRHHQYFTATDWPGGLYASPTFAGSRPGGLSAACWAAMVSIGEDGYLKATRAILETASTIKRGLHEIEELEVIGDPLFCIAFRSASDELDIFRVLDAMGERGWSLNGLHKPAAVHICTTLRHTQPGVAEQFLADLTAAIEEVLAEPTKDGGMAPIYGMAATLPDRTVVSEFLKTYIDMWFKP